MVLYNYVDLHIIFLIPYFLDQTLFVLVWLLLRLVGKPADTVDREIFVKNNSHKKLSWC